MSKTNVKVLEDKRCELTFTVERSVFDAAVDHAFHKNAPKINIPGFRRGKAPRGIIEKFYGKSVFYEDAINEIIPDAFEAAVKETGIEVVGRPEFDVEAIEEDGVNLKAVCYVKPEVKLGTYKGIAADRATHVVTDEDVDTEIGRVRQRNARELDITDRPAQMGDTAVIDYDGSVDGVHFDGGKDEGHHLKLGSGSFIPGFEDQVAGHSVGDEFDVNVTFPENYNASELAGKAAVFACKLHKIEAEELPALDDEFAKDVSEFDTLAEYRADIKAKLEKSAAEAADNALEGRLLNALCDSAEVDIPEPMIADEVENLLRERDYNMRQHGLTLADYLKYTGDTIDTIREISRPKAERNVKTRLALEAVAEAEKIVPTEEEIAAEYDHMAEMYGMKAEDLKKQLAAETVSADVRLHNAVEIIKSSAVVTEKDEETAKAEAEAKKAEEGAKKPAAKKPAAKKTAAKKTETEEKPAAKPAAKKPAAKKAAAKPAGDEGTGE